MFEESSDLRSVLAGNDPLLLLETIHACLACDTREDFAALMLATLDLLPCEHLIAALGYHDDRQGVVIVDGFNAGFPEPWCIAYRDGNYIQVDPVVRANFTGYGLQRWSDARKRYRSVAQEKIAALCGDFGMQDGYTIGSRPLPQARDGAMFCFSGLPALHDRRTPVILRHLVPHLHLAFSRVSHRKHHCGAPIALTRREREVLNWLKQGKSSWEISVILHISERTANYHIYNMMRKLDAVNRPQALATAARLGLIVLD